MAKKHSYIAAGALALAGTVGMASWLALDANAFRETQPAAPQLQAQATSGVAETEGTVAAPSADAAQSTATIDYQPEPAAIGGVVPAPRTSETPARAPQPAPAVTREPRTRVEQPPVAEPANRRTEPANPRTEPVEPVEPVERVEPAATRFAEVTVPANSIIGIRVQTNLTSDTASLEDRVEAVVTRDVIAGGRVAVPAGTRLLGSVNEVVRGGKFKERARLGVRFHTLVIDGVETNIRTDAIVREGDAQARETAAKIGGGAVGGAIIGGIMGGRKGAILGGVAGAGAGTAAVVAGDRSVATLAAGSPLSLRLGSPLTISVERNR